MLSHPHPSATECYTSMEDIGSLAQAMDREIWVILLDYGLEILFAECSISHKEISATMGSAESSASKPRISKLANST